MSHVELEPVLTIITHEEDYSVRLAKFAVESRKLWENVVDKVMTEAVGDNQ